MRTTIKTVLLLLISGFSYAQQDAQFTQYMYNTISINPAYAGSRETLSIFALHRSQWVGLEGAPQTNNISVNTLIKDTNVGIGVSILNDKIGPSDENNIAVDFSYTVPVSEVFKLSFGLKASANLLNIDFNKLNQFDGGDSNFAANIDNKFSPNIGVGFYLHSENTYVGLSMPNLLKTKHYDRYTGTGAASSLATQDIAYYLTVGHVFELNDNLKFKPSVLTKLVQGAPLGLDMSANFLINEKFVAGASYRLNAAVSGLIGFQATDSWFIGYSYDFDTTGLSNYNSGSHELFLRFELFNRYSKIYSPRFF
jgi:type IX secretion system PorP/SprF family membrane protein